MKCNMGSSDRGIRVVVGLSILAWGYFSGSYWGFIGLLPLLTAGLKWCPAYVPFKINTAKDSDDQMS